MDSLVANVAVAEIPLPMPVVMHPIFGIGLLLRRAKPQIVIKIVGGRAEAFVTDVASPAVHEIARHIDAANDAVPHRLNDFLDLF